MRRQRHHLNGRTSWSLVRNTHLARHLEQRKTELSLQTGRRATSSLSGGWLKTAHAMPLHHRQSHRSLLQIENRLFHPTDLFPLYPTQDSDMPARDADGHSRARSCRGGQCYEPHCEVASCSTSDQTTGVLLNSPYTSGLIWFINALVRSVELTARRHRSMGRCAQAA